MAGGDRDADEDHEYPIELLWMLIISLTLLSSQLSRAYFSDSDGGVMLSRCWANCRNRQSPILMTHSLGITWAWKS